MLSIGLMSGTSMDGIEAALLRTDGTPQKLITLGQASLSFDPRFTLLLKAAEYTVRNCQGNWRAAVKGFNQGLKAYLRQGLDCSEVTLNTMMDGLKAYLKQASNHCSLSLNNIVQHSTALHAQVVQKLLDKYHLKATAIDIIGYHGQTLFHQPRRGISTIVGDGQALANALDIPVVNDFRRQDIAAGGQGAPFAPLYHQALAVRDHQLPLAVVNCGGIANVTFISNEDPHLLLGFDTGPGNVLIDKLIRYRSQGRESYDKEGHYGKTGRVIAPVLSRLYENAIAHKGPLYFNQKPPKSLDYNDFTLIPILETLSLPDACRSLAAFSAETMVKSLDLMNDLSYFEPPQQWVLAGGGWKNPVILGEFSERLRARLGASIQIRLADQLGWSSQWMEAEMFAYFAVRHLKKEPISFPNTTGVSQPLSGGTLHLPICNLR